MAEERLIDDDKDRKYKIRKNADGEDELIIDDTPDEDETDIPVFAVPEAEDDEEAAVLTPEEFLWPNRGCKPSLAPKKAVMEKDAMYEITENALTPRSPIL